MPPAVSVAGTGSDAAAVGEFVRTTADAPEYGLGPAELLNRYRIKPGTLILEVTESRHIDDPHAAVAILRPLRNAGVRIALDDFGMGYAGLRQLQHMKSLPVDVLKSIRCLSMGYLRIAA